MSYTVWLYTILTVGFNIHSHTTLYMSYTVWLYTILTVGFNIHGHTTLYMSYTVRLYTILSYTATYCATLYMSYTVWLYTHPQRHGQGRYSSKREGVYEGSWFNDLRQGKGREEYPNKDVFEGIWELDLVSWIKVLFYLLYILYIPVCLFIMCMSQVYTYVYNTYMYKRIKIVNVALLYICSIMEVLSIKLAVCCFVVILHHSLYIRILPHY